MLKIDNLQTPIQVITALYRSRFFRQMISERSTKAYCCEDISKIENYEQAINDNTQTWHCHHRLEIQGEFTNSPKLLKKCGLYYNVPAWQLIFLTRAEHNTLHHHGKHLSAAAKEKMRGNKNFFGKCHSAAAKQKNREAHLGKHPSEETKLKMSKAHCGMCFWNNGVVNTTARECPGPEWKRGRL